MTAIIIHGDTTTIAVPAAQCCITDPPFSAKVHAKGRSGRAFDGEDDARVIPFAPLSGADIQYMQRVSDTLPGWTVLCADIESVGMWAVALTHYMRAIPWVRFSQPQKTGDRPGSGCEMVVTAHPPKGRRWNGPGNLTHFGEPAMRGDGKHPSEKPVDLCLSLVSYFSQPGDVVFDPFAGHASIGVACGLLGRDYIGVEREERWHANAEARLAGTLSDRDRQRAVDWVTAHAEEYHPEPRAKCEEPAYARYLRRMSDVRRVAASLGLADSA